MSREVAEALHRVAGEIDAQPSLQDALESIVHTVLDAVPQVDHASVSRLSRSGQLDTLASSSEFARQVDEVQYETRQGPCVETLEDRRTVTVDGLQDHGRWPVFARRAGELGARGRMAFALDSHGGWATSLNLYSTTADSFDDDSLQIGLLFATQAMLAVGKVRVQENLSQALLTRREIGEAIGIVMERYQLDEDRAFQFLVRVSRDGNLKLRDVARELVEGTSKKNATSFGDPRAD